MAYSNFRGGIKSSQSWLRLLVQASSHCFMATDSLTALSVNSVEATPPAPESNMLPVLHIDSAALNTAWRLKTAPHIIACVENNDGRHVLQPLFKPNIHFIIESGKTGGSLGKKSLNFKWQKFHICYIKRFSNSAKMVYISPKLYL